MRENRDKSVGLGETIGTEEGVGKARAPYKKPTLVTLGKVTQLTMGSQPGTGESGNPAFFFDV